MHENSFTRGAGEWFAGLKPASIKPDILAGLTLWGVLVPEGLAYAGMAGMPVQAGLYTLLASLPLYFLLGGSPVLVCAATSSESILMAAIIGPLAGGDPARYMALTGLLVLTTGAIFLAAGLGRLGRFSSFLSKPVMTGFVFGLAIYIAANQLHKLFGLPRGHGDIFLQVFHLVEHIGQANPATFVIGFCSLGLLFVLERKAPRFPAGLCVMALGIAASRLFDLGPGHGVVVVHTFTAGLPDAALPHIGFRDLASLLPAAMGLTLVAFSQALGAAQTYADKFGRHVDADRELKALGVANIGSSLVGGLLAGGSMSSTAVNVSAGAKSRWSALFTALMVGLTVCYFTPVFRGLPEAVLGAVVLHAVARLMKVAELRRYLVLNRNEFVLAMLALSGVVLLDILPGLILAVVASLLLLIMYASNVTVSVLGAVRGDTTVWVDKSLHETAQEIAGVRVLRLERPLFFANADKIYGKINELGGQEPKPQAVVVQMRANMRLCITSADMILALARELRAAGRCLALIDPSDDMLAILRKNGALALIGENHVYQSVEQAVACLRAQSPGGCDNVGR